MSNSPAMTGYGYGRRSGRDLVRLVLDFFSSVWVGVFWLSLVFVYCSIGSAVPRVRQHPALEMTEFEWFNWWPFDVLMVLFCTSLIVVTVRRIPLRWVNAGVWMIHSGIILLCLGSFYYFGTKVEGDTPVFRRQVRIEMAGLDTPETLLVVRGAETRIRAGSGLWTFQVQSTNSAWPILSDEHKGEKAFAVNVLVTPPQGEPFIRQLLAGYPIYTEDVIPGRGRAVKVIGKKLVNEDLKLELQYEPQDFFHLMDTWALFVRRDGDTEWSQRPMVNLPRYHERLGSRDQVFFDPRFPPRLRPIDLPVSPGPTGDALGQSPVRVTGYLRYAHIERRWGDGGDRLNPVVGISFNTGHAPEQSYELIALDPAHNTVTDGIAEFRWLDDPSEVDSLPTDSRANLRVEVPDVEILFDVPISRETVAGREGEFTEIEGTEFAYRILNVQDNLALPGRRATVSVAIVEIRTPEGVFTRMVADQPGMTRDMGGENADPHLSDSRTAEQADPRIRMKYKPLSAPIILAAHPGGLYLAYNGPGGRAIGKEVRPGDVVELIAGLSIRINTLWMYARAEVRPAIVPPPMRRRNAREMFSMIRVEVDSGAGMQTQWVPFSPYVFPNKQYAYAGRFAYTPRVFRMADGRRVEVIFSRQRRELPAPVAMEDFELDTHLGGYSGQVSTIRNYVSRLRFLEDGTWSRPTKISVNAPTDHGGYWYFQSTWDKPSPNDPTGAMCFTGLGVGNRNGVYIQLLGCCMAVAGMLFSFYVKPVIRRRARAARGTMTSSVGAEESQEEEVTYRAGETVEV